MADVYIDPTKLKPLPRTVVPEIVDMAKMAPPPSFPALPWLLALVCLVAMPLCFSITMYYRHGHETCDRDVVLYLQGQAICSIVFLAGVGALMFKRINWVGALKDAVAELPELPTYALSTTLWWFELGWTLFGVVTAAEASACSDGLKYASRTLGGYMLGLGVWLDLGFHVLGPSVLHLYSGQPGVDLLPPGAGFVDPPDAMPPPPPKRKKPPPKRECPKCKLDAVADALKLCPVCGAFVPPLEYFVRKQQAELSQDQAEKDKREHGVKHP